MTCPWKLDVTPGLDLGLIEFEHNLHFIVQNLPPNKITKKLTQNI